jgi:phage anti-repressor protein
MRLLNNINKLYYFRELKNNFKRLYRDFVREIFEVKEMDYFSLKKLEKIKNLSYIDINTRIYKRQTYNDWYEQLVKGYKK